MTTKAERSERAKETYRIRQRLRSLQNLRKQAGENLDIQRRAHDMALLAFNSIEEEIKNLQLKLPTYRPRKK